MRQLRFAFAFVLMLPGVTFGQEAAAPGAAPATAPQGPESRFRVFFNASFISPLFYLQALGAGLIDEVSGFPKEWDGAEGFRDRTVVRLAQGFVAEGLGHGVAAIVNHRVQYDACRCEGALRRTKHALGRGFVSITDDGGRGPNVSLWIAKYGSAAIADPWYPASYKQKDVLIQGSVALAIAAGLNIVREFAPDLARLVPF